MFLLLLHAYDDDAYDDDDDDDDDDNQVSDVHDKLDKDEINIQNYDKQVVDENIHMDNADYAD